MQVEIRNMVRNELSDIWSIDRSERIEGVYRHEDGKLQLVEQLIDLSGWPLGAQEQSEPVLLDCFDHSGVFIGAFTTDRLVGVSVLDVRAVGGNKERLQFKFLHIDRKHRGEGLGRKLFDLAAERARELCGRSLYISSAPTKNTVQFYQSLGCRLTDEVDPTLFAFEPDDIHLEFSLF